MKKYVYYQIHIYTTEETDKKLGRLALVYGKDTINEVLGMSWQEINSVPMEEVKQFYKLKKRQRTVYVDKETYEKWKQIPRSIKQQAIYLVYKKLMEVEL
jgi:cbb3-type cytochrome oxidase cytochrome c subunit